MNVEREEEEPCLDSGHVSLFTNMTFVALTVEMTGIWKVSTACQDV